MQELGIDKAKKALVVIDLQKGIAAQDTNPYSAQKVIKCCTACECIQKKRYARILTCRNNKRECLRSQEMSFSQLFQPHLLNDLSLCLKLTLL
jgi:nicotinamidase-related amidase